MALVADIDNYDPDAEAVVLMTVHSAKGLEFPVVFLPALEESIFPSSQSLYDESELEEERRLAYVAVTRAKERLYISHTRERLIYGKTSYNKLSPFIKDVPETLLDAEMPKARGGFGGGATAGWQSGAVKESISDEFTRKTAFIPKPKTAGDRFSVGDTVSHALYGQGVIMSVTPMGPDVMYEIAFDNVGTKRMMGNYAKIKRV
jgi:DNA helicase-2/ATP-dependent DNA helicase PcrA